LAQGIAALISSAYPDRTVTYGGPIDASGAILAHLMIGRSSRLVRLIPNGGAAVRA
jgi:hypothetical protein